MLTATAIQHGGLGRFGNQLWTIAGVIGIATKSGQPYGFPKWVNQDAANFGGSRDDMSQYFVNPLPVAVDVPYTDYGYFWGYRDITLPTGNWNINAHMQSDKFTRHCMPLIRDTFRMHDEPTQNNMVAIHYRGGDYQHGEDCHHPRCDKAYYLAAMAQFPADTEFILFSDEPETFQRMIDGVYHIARGTYIEDFKLMKRCKSFITANSSFSSFAALLGEHPGKKVVMPRVWFGKSWPDPVGMTVDLYHENAIVL